MNQKKITDPFVMSSECTSAGGGKEEEYEDDEFTPVLAGLLMAAWGFAKEDDEVAPEDLTVVG